MMDFGSTFGAGVFANAVAPELLNIGRFVTVL
jgi:hypothetical protein